MSTLPKLDRPLAGRTIAITRAAEQAGALVDRLTALGANVEVVPAVAIHDPVDGGAALQAAVGNLHTYEWVVLTSPNAARKFAEAAARAARTAKIAAIGPGTAQVLEEAGLRVDLVPQRSIGEGLVDAFPQARSAAPSAAPSTAKVLFPKAEITRPVVAEGLRAKGWTVDEVIAYRTLPAPITDEMRSVLRGVDLIVLTSSSTASVTADALGETFAPAEQSASRGVYVVSMGPATTATASERGLPVVATANPSTIEGLINAVTETVRRVYPHMP